MCVYSQGDYSNMSRFKTDSLIEQQLTRRKSIFSVSVLIKKKFQYPKAGAAANTLLLPLHGNNPASRSIDYEGLGVYRCLAEKIRYPYPRGCP
jgi:hypothetical protein